MLNDKVLEISKDFRFEYEYKRCTPGKLVYDEILSGFYYQNHYLGLVVNNIHKKMSEIGFDLTVDEVFILCVSAFIDFMNILKTAGDDKKDLVIFGRHMLKKTLDDFLGVKQKTFGVKASPVKKNPYLIYRK